MKTVKPYTYFSIIYNHLMQSVDYEFWADYIREIHQTIGRKSDEALEIASGNCTLSKYLLSEFKMLILTDLSFEMLNFNTTKLPAVCCDMIHLPFKKKFDFIFSAFDSVNYLHNEELLYKFFNNLRTFLKKEAFFAFDISLKNNSLKHVEQLNRMGKFRGIEYKQVSDFNEESALHKNELEIKIRSGKVFREIHIQKIYDFYYYFEVLEKSGLYIAECFDAFTFNEGSPESDRIQFIVKRKY